MPITSGLSPREVTILGLERALAKSPKDSVFARKLLNQLDSYFPGVNKLGHYTEAQRKLLILTSGTSYFTDLLRENDIADRFRSWFNLVRSSDADLHMPITQLFAGRNHTIGGLNADCDLRLSLFGATGVVSGLCVDCYKVQILPPDLATMIKIYIMFRAIDLPRDNTRKCMVELRENVRFPYKGYIYCESEDEALTCLKAFKSSLRKFEINDVYAGISHGCSEFSLKYPNFKYSSDGSHRTFARPTDWDSIERDFYSRSGPSKGIGLGFNKRGLSLRDVAGIRTWISYAELIGDRSCQDFHREPNVYVTDQFVERTQKQAVVRFAELAEVPRVSR